MYSSHGLAKQISREGDGKLLWAEWATSLCLVGCVV